MSLHTMKALNAASLARAVAFAKNEDENISIVLPEDLSTLGDAELEQLRTDAVAAFNELRAEGTLSADKVAVLRDLKAAVGALSAEKDRRAADVAALAAEVEALAAEVNASADSDEDEGEELAGDEVEDGDEDEAVEDEVEEALVAASHPRSISVPRLKARQAAAKAPEAAAPKAVSPIKAAMGLDSFGAGTALSMDQLADAFAELTEAARPGPVQAARRANGRFSQKHKIAHIEKPFDPRAVVGQDGDADAAVKFAVDQTRLKGGSLLASGGWCAPSETLYDLCKLESTDGILSLPEIAVRRGGIRFTQGPDWADIFANTGWCFTEADDQAGSYSLTNEIQSLTEGGSGLTSYTLTYDGQTTASIDDDATAAQVQAALEALSNIAVGDVVVTGGGAPFVFQVEFTGTLAGTDVPALTSTPTGGTGTVTVAVVQNGGQPGGPKPTDIVPCPTFTDVRLDVCGVTIQAGILLNRAYPELVARYVSGALTAHMHRVATNVLNDMIAGSDAFTPTKPTGDDASVLAPILSAIELQAEDIKYRNRMARGTVLEAIFPFWVRGAIRADLSRRQGVDLLSVTDAQIDGWFRQRGINAQFIYNFDNLSGAGALVWPSTVRFLIYPAGTWVRGSSELITLSMLHDSTLNENNNFTAIFTEEGWSVMKLCHVSRIVTVNICPGGQTGAAADYSCA